MKDDMKYEIVQGSFRVIILFAYLWGVRECKREWKFLCRVLVVGLKI